jgi:hypothetical protein
MRNSFSIVTIALFFTACGASQERDNLQRTTEERTSARRFNAECVVPGESPAQCMAYSIKPIAP